MRWTRGAAADEKRLSCGRRSRVGPDASTPASSSGNYPPMTVTRKPRSPGRAEGSALKTIAQGRPGVSGEPVVTTLVCFFILHASAGASRARHSRALVSENLSECANGRLRTNRPLLELSPLRPKATDL